MSQKLKSRRSANTGFVIASLIAATWLGQAGAEEKPFKFEILPSDKCVLQKVDEVDTELKCLKLSVAPRPSPTKPGDPRPENRHPTSMPISASEMQTILNWCKNKSGIWTSDGKNSGSCRFSSAHRESAKPVAKPAVKTKAGCEAMGKVWDGGKGNGGCTGPRPGSNK